MLAFIDDSGDPGFKLGFGSSQHFVIAVVIFDDELEAQTAALEIRKLTREIFSRDDVEWKFNKSDKKNKIKFLKTISRFNFRIRYLIADKKLVYSQKLKTDKNAFYSYFIKLVLKHSGGAIRNAKIKIDGSGDREFKRSFSEYLRRELNTGSSRVMLDCKLVNSKGNVLIQMADMIAGAIRCSYEIKRTDAKTYKEFIKNHIEDPWEFR